MHRKIISGLKTAISVLPAVLFLFYIYYMMINTYTGTIKRSVTDSPSLVEGFEHLSDTYEETLQENIHRKNDYVNLNGITARVMGMNSLNNAIKLENGYLAEIEGHVDVSTAVNHIIELNGFLSERDIDFIYLLAPSKESIYDVEFAPGYDIDLGQNIDNVIESLDAAGVNTIDMDQWYEENGWHTEDVFFITDHHWKPEAALSASRRTMEYLDDQGISDYHEEWLSDENWNITKWEDIFLGSLGKRTGTTYAGVDDFTVYEPKFETNYTYSTLDFNTTTWMYHDTLLNLSYTTEVDYFNTTAYSTYLYNDYPLNIITYTKGWNDQRVLVMGDSYKLPYEYFLSTQFKEIYTIDLRYYTDGSLAEYIEEIQPDIVMMCTYEGAFANGLLYDFGVGKYNAALQAATNSEAIYLGDASIEAKGDDHSFTVIKTNMKPNQAYTLTIDTSAYTGGEDLYIQMTLQDLSTNEAVYHRYFDANNDESQKWVFTTPDNPNGNYAIYLYAGINGHTSNCSIEVTGIELQEGIIEDHSAY